MFKKIISLQDKIKNIEKYILQCKVYGYDYKEELRNYNLLVNKLNKYIEYLKQNNFKIVKYCKKF